MATSDTHSLLTWGVLGTGGIAGKVLTVGIRRAGHTVLAVGSRSAASAQAFADKFAITKAYGSYQEVLDDGEIDAVYIALPSALHKEWTLKAAKAKKHILCEKPVAPFTEDVVEMVEACKAAGVVFLDGTFFKHHPRNKLIKDMVDAGELGDVSSVFSQFSCDAREMAADAIRHRPDMERTGALGDMGWYTIRFGLHVYGYELPERVIGTIVKRHPETGACTHFIGQLHFANNRIALFDTSFAQADSQRTHISGTKAILALDDAFVPWKGLIDMKNPSAFIAPLQDTFEISTKAGVWETRSVAMHGVVEEVMMVRDLAACVDGAKSWEAWAEETIVIHRVIDALWESAELGSVPVVVKK
ncbi:hypothetical protein HDU77_004248 [Chytriomyces hyalinus]|nr:hypothetical protein HDU77_004242 [Chytriomyces hyalinus]KAJ3265718.1 hypothetical protein HDU77_004248 [Chytriomyces hyalinus]